MKIGVYGGSYKAHGGGVFTFQNNVLRALPHHQGKHKFYLFCDDDEMQSLYPNLPVVVTQRREHLKNDSFVRKMANKCLFNKKVLSSRVFYETCLQRNLHENNIDVMWFLTPENYQVNVPYIFTVWDLQHRLQPYFPEVSFAQNGYEGRERLYGSVLPRAAYIIVGNDAGKEEIERFYGVPSWRIKINPLPTPAFVFDKTIKPSGIFDSIAIKKPYLFYPAQFWPHKNHVVILYAVKILKEQYGKQFDVVFTGSDKGNMQYIKDVVADLGLQENVYFLGFVDIATLVNLYKNAYALVYASFFGPDNIPPLEAFGLGCPVIAARVSGSQYQLEGAALLFDPTSEFELVDKILQMQNNDQAKHVLLNNGLQRAHQYSSLQYVENMLNFFDEFESIRRCWSSKVLYQPL